jgi:hypothetical protein
MLDAPAPQAPKWWDARLKPVLLVVAVAVSMLLLTGTVVSFVRSEKDRRNGQAQRRIANAQSVLENCLAIEDLKDAERGDREANLKILPTISYYKTRPDELEIALKATRESIARFKPEDCYALPTVHGVGLKPRTKQPLRVTPDPNPAARSGANGS